MSWNSNAPRETVLKLADTLEAELAKLPAIKGDGFDELDAARRSYLGAVEDLKSRLTSGRSDGPLQGFLPKIRDRGDGASFSLLGFRASCTSGVVGAIWNWIAQVRRKAGI